MSKFSKVNLFSGLNNLEDITLDGMIADDNLLSSFDVDEIAPEALLFQTGYLTIAETSNEDGDTYITDFHSMDA